MFFAEHGYPGFGLSTPVIQTSILANLFEVLCIQNGSKNYRITQKICYV